ncbi:hypothetical protein LJC36_00270 [Desulfovibrio sp. OttesenSCG-928-C14]|nr:hypothetical protein [Desulfovibrio sp. OttesenSCG-928-C14]
MFRIPLENIPNQVCSVRIDGALFELRIKVARGSMTASVSRDSVALVRGARCLPFEPLIPYRYLAGHTGNFYFVNEDGAYPHYSRFGSEDTLLYLGRDELEALRNG